MSASDQTLNSHTGCVGEKLTEVEYQDIWTELMGELIPTVLRSKRERAENRRVFLESFEVKCPCGKTLDGSDELTMGMCSTCAGDK